MKRTIRYLTIAILLASELLTLTSCSSLDKNEEGWKYDSSKYSRADNSKMEKARKQNRDGNSDDHELEELGCWTVGASFLVVGYAVYEIVSAPFALAAEKKAEKIWEQRRAERVAAIQKSAKSYREANPGDYDEWLESVGMVFDKESDENSRLEIVKSIGQIKGQRADSILMRAMYDPLPSVRKEACVQWGKREKPWMGTAPLQSLMEREKNPEVRGAAEQALQMQNLTVPTALKGPITTNSGTEQFNIEKGAL